MLAPLESTRRLPIYFLFRQIATLEYRPDDAWRAVEGIGASRLKRLVISHVTTRSPMGSKSKLLFSGVEMTCGIASHLFSEYIPETLYAVCPIPHVGRVFITGHPHSKLQLQLIRDRGTSVARDYNIVFDLDDTLIYNPTHAAEVVPGSQFVNPAPPHRINAAEDVPYMRPNLEAFLDLVCPYFRQIRVCTMSMRQRAHRVVSLLDPAQQTLLRNQPAHGEVVACREDMGLGEDCLWPVSSGPPVKSLHLCHLPAGKETKTVILDDRWDVWSDALRENLVAVVPPQEMGPRSHDEYLNGEDGGTLGKHILLCLINLALKEERRLELVRTPLPIGLPSTEKPQRSRTAAVHRPTVVSPVTRIATTPERPLQQYLSSHIAAAPRLASLGTTETVPKDTYASGRYMPSCSPPIYFGAASRYGSEQSRRGYALRQH